MIIRLEKDGSEKVYDGTSVNYLYEALTFLNRRVNSLSADTVLKSLVGKFEEYGDELKMLAKPIVELESYLNTQLDIPEDRLVFFFKQFREMADDTMMIDSNIEGYNLASLILCMPEYNDIELDTFTESLKSMNPGQIRYQICGALHVLGLDPKADELSTEEFAKHIDSLRVSLENKWDIIDAYKHFNTYVDELSAIIRPVMALIVERADLYSGLVDSFIRLYTSIPNLSVYLSEKFNMDVADSLPLEAHPSIFGFDMVSVIRAARATTSKLYVGVLVNRLVDISSHDETILTISNITKALSDSGRMEILCYLRDNSAYGQELSDRFKLSTTTIWHHMNKLQVSGFVNSIFSGNRTYYTMDKNKVRAYISRLKRLLLNEE